MMLHAKICSMFEELKDLNVLLLLEKLRNINDIFFASLDKLTEKEKEDIQIKINKYLESI